MVSSINSSPPHDLFTFYFIISCFDVQPQTYGQALVHLYLLLVKSLPWLLVAIRSNRDLYSLKCYEDTIIWVLVLMNWQKGRGNSQ